MTARFYSNFKPRQILRIDNTHRHIVVINHDQIVNAMTLQQVQNFHRSFSLCTVTGFSVIRSATNRSPIGNQIENAARNLRG
jgi:hypothetical protein